MVKQVKSYLTFIEKAGKNKAGRNVSSVLCGNRKSTGGFSFKFLK